MIITLKDLDRIFILDRFGGGTVSVADASNEDFIAWLNRLRSASGEKPFTMRDGDFGSREFRMGLVGFINDNVMKLTIDNREERRLVN